MQCFYSWFCALLLAMPVVVHAAEADCAPQTQIDVSRIDQQIVLIGEAHGTNEIPRFTAGLVCSLLKAGKSVILGIEHGGEEQAALNLYLESGGDPVDRMMLMQSSVNWKLYSDGRGSVAMLDLVDTMRRLRKRGQRIGVIAFQPNDDLFVPQDAADRLVLTPADSAFVNRINDADMADRVLYAAILYRRRVIVILAGNAHTSTLPAKSDDTTFGIYRTMGQIITSEAPAFVIGIESDGGTQAATGTEGSKGYALPAGPLYREGAQIDAVVHLGRLTASPPARDAAP